MGTTIAQPYETAPLSDELLNNQSSIPSADSDQTLSPQSSVLSPQRLRVEVVKDDKAFAEIRDEWAELLNESNASAFNSWEWLYPWYQRFASGKPLRILTARDEAGRLIGLMPLYLQERWALVAKVRRLSFLGDTHVDSDYLDIVARRGYERGVNKAFDAALQDKRLAWDVLDLLDLDENSPTIEAFREGFSNNRYEVEVTERNVCPYIAFTPGQPFEEFLKGTSRRDNFRQRRKWLEKQPTYALRRVTDPAEIPAALDEFMRLHTLRWAGEGGSDAITAADVDAYHHDAAKLLAERGLLHIYLMELEGKAVAASYNIVDRGKLSYYLSGRDPEWANRSVSLVLLGIMVQDSIESGLTEFDMLRGLEQYKMDWTKEMHHTSGLRILDRRGRGAWLRREEHVAKAARDLAKKTMPEKLAERARRILRKRR